LQRFYDLGDWCREKVPFIEAATSLTPQDFTFFCEPGRELLLDTFSKVGQVTLLLSIRSSGFAWYSLNPDPDPGIFPNPNPASC
jgi:hypothetical protein